MFQQKFFGVALVLALAAPALQAAEVSLLNVS